MKILVTCLLCFVVNFLFAQQKQDVIQKDTINIHGYVYDHNGKPAVGALIESRQLDLVYNRFRIAARTDSNGFFKLNGAKRMDTLSISTKLFPMSGIKCMNKGSRYLVVYLPLPTTPVINADNPILVTAIRKEPVKIPTFKILPLNQIIDSWEFPPSYMGGNDRFIDYIKKRLHYPENAVNHHIEGTVQVQFTVTSDGSVTGVKILKGIGYGCDEEVVNAVKSSRKWSPGLVNGWTFNYDTSVTVEFKLVSQ